MKHAYYKFASAVWLIFAGLVLILSDNLYAVFFGILLATLWQIAGTMVYHLTKDKSE
jgi:hypothetical protein